MWRWQPIVNLSTVRLPIPRGERGQGLAEYALILTLVGAAAVVMLTFFSDAMGSMLSYLGNAL